MADLSFYWHDYETFGVDPRRDRPAQFAGVRTDAELNEIGEPLMLHCQPAPDFLPEPEACLITGILPQECLARGVPENAFAAAILRELAADGTVGVGYNSLRFDDEVTRFMLWRNLHDPYAREWQNECGRWDLLDVVRATWALRPEGIEWPVREDGQASFRLEMLTAANGLAHAQAHDALSDVRATIALARLLRQRQPRLWEFALRLRRKQAVMDEIGVGRPFLHLSGRYAPGRGCMALVWPLAPHPTNRNELIVWDLSHDPAELFDLRAPQIRERLFTRTEDLPDGVTRLPIKTIHLNRSPFVVSSLRTLRDDRAQAFGLDIAAGLRHAERAARQAHTMAGIWPEVYARPGPAEPRDVDEALYDGLLGNADRRTLDRLRELPSDQLAAARPVFEDERLEELLFRYRARIHPQTLSDEERLRWEAHRAARLHDGKGGALTLAAFFDRVDRLGEAAEDERSQALLGSLYDYAESIAPDPAAGGMA